MLDVRRRHGHPAMPDDVGIRDRRIVAAGEVGDPAARPIDATVLAGDGTTTREGPWPM